MSKIARKITNFVPDSPYCETIEHVQTLYFEWLVNWMGMDDENMDASYRTLARMLHDMEFYWVNELDENRAKDGIRLRHIWFDSISAQADDMSIGRPLFPLDSLTGPCSVFEMLIALADRIEIDIMQDDNMGCRTTHWFWSMLGNLGIVCDDSRLGLSQSNSIIDAVTKMMDREYDRFGNGGLFILNHTDRDMRDLDIWWQAQLWLAENYSD